MERFLRHPRRGASRCALVGRFSNRPYHPSRRPKPRRDRKAATLGSERCATSRFANIANCAMSAPARGLFVFVAQGSRSNPAAFPAARGDRRAAPRRVAIGKAAAPGSADLVIKVRGLSPGSNVNFHQKPQTSNARSALPAMVRVSPTSPPSTVRGRISESRRSP